jgi:hypothetical protein
MGGEEAYTGLWWENRERGHLVDPGVDRRMILRWICRKWDVGCGGMDWIELAKDRNRSWALVNAALNLRVP